MTLAADLRWSRSLCALPHKDWAIRTRDGCAAGFVAGVVLGLGCGIWLATTSGDDDDISPFDLLWIITTINTILSAFVGTFVSFVASRVEPLRLRLLIGVLAGLSAMIVAGRLLGSDVLQSPLEYVPLVGGTLGAAWALSCKPVLGFGFRQPRLASSSNSSSVAGLS